MKRTGLIRLGGLAAMVGGAASATLGLLYVLQATGMTLGPIERAVQKGNYENPVLTMLLVGVLAAIATLHAIQRRHYGSLGALVSLVAFVGVAMTVGANLLGELVPAMAPMAINLLIVGVPAAFVGVVGLGIVTLGAQVLRRWCGAALVIAGVLGLPAIVSGGIGWTLLGGSGIVEDGTPTGLRERLRLFLDVPVLRELRVNFPLLLSADTRNRKEGAYGKRSTNQHNGKA